MQLKNFAVSTVTTDNYVGSLSEVQLDELLVMENTLLTAALILKIPDPVYIKKLTDAIIKLQEALKNKIF